MKLQIDTDTDSTNDLRAAANLLELAIINRVRFPHADHPRDYGVILAARITLPKEAPDGEVTIA